MYRYTLFSHHKPIQNHGGRDIILGSRNVLGCSKIFLRVQNYTTMIAHRITSILPQCFFPRQNRGHFYGQSSYYLFLQGFHPTRREPSLRAASQAFAPRANRFSLLLRPHEYRREVSSSRVQKRYKKRPMTEARLKNQLRNRGSQRRPLWFAPPSPLRGQVRSTRWAVARRVAVPNAKPDAKKKTRARYFLGRCAGTGRPAASASRAR